MGSLNGDIMVIRNGRSTSQVSIYNYPEHLNPFYEDDQHKRLRFWKISKKDNDGRRNSFSIGNLKDMWALKSFRIKKKSSTLGINKTSESPPTLRRDLVIDNGWNTLDHRLRGANGMSLNCDNFQRNATYRSSLQTLPTSNADRIGLNRNDGYRSTIQVTRSNHRYQPQQSPQSTGVSQNRRYVYGGSVTPQPMRSTNICRGSNDHESDSVITRRSSQSSMVSTNPFESDDDENEDINSSGIKSVNGGSTTTLTSRTPRKKRRAPAPPIPIHNRINAATPPTILIESSHDSTNDELHIKEDIDIANLTAEIQNFVETTNNDDVEISKEPRDNRLITENSVIINRENTNSRVIGSATSALENSANYEHAFNNSIEAKVTPNRETNGKITNAIVTGTTTSFEANKPLEQQPNFPKVAKVIEVKINESEEAKTNGAIPKKPNKVTDTIYLADKQQSINAVDDLCITETKIENMQQKPTPLKRQTKPVQEVGNVECIHVHVESPKATPRKEHQSGVSSFKTSESFEDTEAITKKTPFVLMSPPTHKKIIQPQAENTSAIKETVKIINFSNENEPISELNLTEERFNSKPEILIKPTLSPKPVLKQPNVKTHGFAEIHKPMRSKFSSNQNSQVRKTLHEESVSPPSLLLENAKEEVEKKKINNINLAHSESNNVKSEERKENQLKIVENISNCESLVKSTKEHFKRDDDLDLLYRPKPASHMEWRRSTLAPLETNIPPEKRKSVKDIIESINRSQRLLNAAANKDFTSMSSSKDDLVTNSQSMKTTETHNFNNNFNEDLKLLQKSQKEIQRMVNEIDQTVENTNDAAGVSSLSPSPSPSNYNNEMADAQKLDNNEIFQKCKVKKEVYDYRESSPISSNLDWNPLPKPKRTKPGHD